MRKSSPLPLHPDDDPVEPDSARVLCRRVPLCPGRVRSPAGDPQVPGLPRQHLPALGEADADVRQVLEGAQGGAALRL